jgi:hypothetical protein
VAQHFKSGRLSTRQYFAVVAVPQGTTTIAAAIPGKRHKVHHYQLTFEGDGSLKFMSGSNNLTGPIYVLKNVVMNNPPSGGVGFYIEANINEALLLVTTGGPLDGVVAYSTEP